MTATVSNYPSQRNSRSFKRTNEQYRKDTANFLVSHAISLNDKNEIDRLYQAAKGVINEDDYKKILNPYNATDPKYKKFPASLRNYDMIRPIIRRYLGEFIKQVHNFQVKIANSDVVMLRNQYVAAEVTKIAMQQFKQILAQQAAQAQQQQAAQQGQAQGQAQGQPIQPPEMPDFQAIVNDIKTKYIDERAVKGQDLLEAIQDWTDSTVKYYQCFYDYIVTGSCYTYRDVRGDTLIKDSVSPYHYYPISNGEFFVEDHDQGVCIKQYSYEQVLSKLGHMFDETKVKLITDFIEHGQYGSTGAVYVPLHIMNSISNGDAYTTFAKSRLLDNTSKNICISKSGRTVNVAHIVYKTEVPIWFVKGTPKAYGLSIKDFEDAVFDDTVPNEYRDANVKLQKDWIFETWEIYQVGDPELGIYTIPQPVICQRRDFINPANPKLPYNGLCELLTDAGIFSIPEYIAPYQAMRNIVFYAREKVIAKNKDKVILMPKSLVAKDGEDKMHRMGSDGVLVYDDSEDGSATRQQGFRVLDASLYNYIQELTQIGNDIRNEAWDAVDMNPQRLGDIATSAGATTTQEAIVRSSMGSVIIFTMFDKFREHDYQADLDFAKVAYVQNNAGQYIGSDGQVKNLEFNIDDHINTMYGIHVLNSQVENDKFNKLESVVLAAAQNGKFDLAIEAVNSSSVAKLASTMRKFQETERKYEQQQAQTEHENAMAVQQQANDMIEKKFQQDMQIVQFEQENENYRKELEVGSATLTTSLQGETDQTIIKQETDAFNARMKDRELMLKEKQHNDNIQVKREDIASKERIAKENKNKYDK